MDTEIKKDHPAVKGGALNNCHGDWYEWLISIFANNHIVQNRSEYVLLQLPNITRFDVASLYEERLFNHIKDLRDKVIESSGVSLITSNPDFVIIKTTGIDLEGLSVKKIDDLDNDVITELENRYQFFKGKCGFGNIVGFLSVKTSLRPDRRLQISHEGSLMKAIYVHLQTRDWVINPQGLLYFAASTEISEPDKKGLRTVATHSITNVQSKPEAAVDDVFRINCVSDIEGFLSALSERM